MSELLDWVTARDRVIDAVSPLPAVRRPVTEALGLALAEPVTSPEDMPPFAHSAMDGFAVRSADTEGASEGSPVVLPVTETIAAAPGRPARLAAGSAARIMTGGAIPEGADAVVPVEHTQFWDPATARSRRPGPGDTTVSIRRSASAGAHIRPAGESVRQGDRILDAGRRLTSADLGLLISVGVVGVNVHPLPRVGVFSTGDELVPPGAPLGPGQIRDSNRPALLARLAEWGFPTLDLGTLPDAETVLTERLRAAAPKVDFLLTSGGVSVGDFDLTRDVLAKLGQVTSYRVAVKPGKPQLFGSVLGAWVFGLPGNPVSSLVVFDQFVLPALLRLAGRTQILPPVFEAVWNGTLARKPGRTEFVRVHLKPESGRWTATPTGPQGSGILRSMSLANGYAVIPGETASLEPGASVNCQLMRWD